MALACGESTEGIWERMKEGGVARLSGVLASEAAGVEAAAQEGAFEGVVAVVAAATEAADLSGGEEAGEDGARRRKHSALGIAV